MARTDRSVLDLVNSSVRATADAPSIALRRSGRLSRTDDPRLGAVDLRSAIRSDCRHGCLLVPAIVSGADLTLLSPLDRRQWRSRKRDPMSRFSKEESPSSPVQATVSDVVTP
jgi:hypothetical protein